MVFPFLAAALTIPFFIYEYRKFGSLPWLRGLIVYSFIFYLLCALFLTMLPLPTKEAVASLTFNPIQPVPFQFVKDFLNETVLVIGDSSTYLPALKQNVFYQPVFNLLLLVPLGVYLRYYYKRSWKQTIIFSFLLSLFFEITQLTGIYGFYPRSYRLFDVDDLILNTLGGLLGYILTPLLVFSLPKREEIDQKAYDLGTQVSLVRRSVAVLIDWLILSIVNTAFALVGKYFGGTPHPLNSILFTSIYFMVLPVLFNGQTPGKKVVKIKIVDTSGGRLSLFSLVKRYSLIYVGFPLTGYILESIFTSATLWQDEFAQAFVVFGALGLFFIYVVSLVVFSVYIIICFIKKQNVLFYEGWSKTYLISTINT